MSNPLIEQENIPIAEDLREEYDAILLAGADNGGEFASDEDATTAKFIERCSRAEAEQDAWRLPPADRHCPFCSNSDYVTINHAHYHKGVIGHEGVVCTDYAGLVLKQLLARNAEVAQLKAERDDYKSALWRMTHEALDLYGDTSEEAVQRRIEFELKISLTARTQGGSNGV